MIRTSLQRSVVGLVTVVATLRLSCRTGFFNLGITVSRRALIKLGGIGLTVAATGAWRGRSAEGASAAGNVQTMAELAATCVLTPEQTEGPYYIAREKVRSNISEHKPGVPLKLQFAVV